MANEKLVAIVTGGSKGLGYAIVKEFLTNGYDVCTVDIDVENGQKAVKDLQAEYLSCKVLFFEGDISQKTDFEAAFEFTLKEFLRIDVLVNNAGYSNEIYPEKIIGTDLMGTVYGCRLAMQYMGKNNGGNGGFVVNIVSITAFTPHEQYPTFCAAKHGVAGLTKSYGTSQYFEETGIMFFALGPSLIATPFVLSLLESGKLRPHSCSKILLKPCEVGQAIFKLFRDKKNGSMLAVTSEEELGQIYIEHKEAEIFTTYKG